MIPGDQINIYYGWDICNKYIGLEKYLEYTVEPDDASNDDVIIACSDLSVLSIDHDEESVTALKPGEVTVSIICKDDHTIKEKLKIKVIGKENK